MTPDLITARGEIAAQRTTATALLDASLAAADGGANRHTFIRRFDAMARAVAASVDAQHACGAPLPPLAGLAISVKDLFDVQGHVTTAGSTVLADRHAAACDAPAVARLRSAGAALVAHTNMTEFAFSGVGINPHHGTPANPATHRIDNEARIPGGSTSGGAVSVATGAAWAALGSASRARRGSSPPKARFRCRRRWTRPAPSPARCATPSCCTRCWPSGSSSARATH